MMDNTKKFPLSDFTGGLNTDKTLRHLAQNELRIANNIDFSERGGIKNRPSFEVYKTITNADIQFIFEWNMSNGNSILIAVLDNGDIIRTDTEEVIGNTSFISSGFSYIVLQEYLYILDGNNYYRIDDELFNMEEVQPIDTSYYEYYAEEFEEVTATTYSLEFKNLQEGSETVQDSFGEEGEYDKDVDYTIDYDAGTLSPLSSGSMIDNTIFVEYNHFIESDVDLTNIKKCKYFTRHMKSNRFFAAGNPDEPSALYYSEMLEPNNFKGYSVVYPTTNDGAIIGLETLNDMLLVFFKNSIWVWRGIDPQRDAVWDKLPLKHGTYNKNSIALTSNTLTFVDLDNIYSLSSMNSTNNITENKISNVIKSVYNKENIMTMFVSKDNKYFLAYSETSGANDKLLMGDWNIGAFSVWDNLDCNDIEYTLDGNLYLSHGDTIYRLTEDYINPVTMKFRTGEFVLGNPYDDKLIRRLHVSLNKVTGNSKIKLITDDETIVYDITSRTQRFDVEKRTVTLQVEFEDTSSEQLILYDIGIEYKPISTYRSDKL